MKRVLQDGEMNSEDATRNLLKEATALSSVQHPHIVTVYDAGIDEEGPYVVMELINGKTLDEMVERGTLTFEDFREVAVQSQEAMIAAQDLDLVHRDLKPSNVMVSWLPSGRFQVKIVDFGLAKFSAKPSLQTIDHGDAVFGSIFFMAPEQFERTPLDRRTDMYSLGAMYYYALAGEYPFNGDTAPQVMAAHLQNKVTPLIEVRPDLPPWLCEWVMWHIQRNMDDRPESARDSLEKFLANDTAHTHGLTAPQPLVAAPTPGGAQPAPAGGGKPKLHTGPPSQQAVSGNTGPQPITSPDGRLNPHTAAHRMVTGQGQLAQTAATATATTAHQANVATPTTSPTPSTVAPSPAPAQPAPTIEVDKPAPTPTPAPAPAPGLNSPAPASGPNSPAPVEANAQPPEELLAQQQKSNKTKIIIAGTLGGLCIIAIVVFALKKSANSENSRYNKIMEQVSADKRQIPMNKKDLTMILERFRSFESTKDREALRRALEYATASSEESYDVDAFITTYATDGEMADNVRKAFFLEVIGQRKGPSTLNPLLKFVEDKPTDKSAPSAITAASRLPKDNLTKEFNRIADILVKSTGSLRSEVSGLLMKIVKASSNRTEIAQQLINRYESTSSDEARRSIIALLGATSANKAKELLSKSIKSEDEGIMKAAAEAYSQWDDDTVLDDIINAIRDLNFDPQDSNKRDSNRRKRITLFKNAATLLSSDREHQSPEDQWKQIAFAAANYPERSVLIKSIGSKRKDWGIPVLQAIQEDAKEDTPHDQDSIDYAERAINTIRAHLEKEKKGK